VHVNIAIVIIRYHSSEYENHIPCS